MPPIKYTEVISYSSEDPKFPADNLLQPDTYKKWKCAPNVSEKQSFVIVKFDKLNVINSLDIGNEGSALVEVLVSREGLSDYKLLLVASSFMSPAESRNGTDLNRVRMFGPEKLNENVAEQKWDRMKVICTQPFNTNMQYGLSFITARSLENEAKDESSSTLPKLGSFKLRMEDKTDTVAVGSVFTRRNESTSVSPTGAAAIRVASREAAASTSLAGLLKRKDTPANEDTNQVKKKTATEAVRSPITKDLPSSLLIKYQKKEKETDKAAKTDKNEKKPNPKDSKPREEKEKKEENKNKTKEQANRPSTSKTDSQEASKKRKSQPFTSLMDGVVFAMSGYQNPERSTLRNKLTEMGAQYKSDWGPECTHLICAFTNTPKYRQVKGKGKIVSGKWITECYKDKIRYPWRRHSLEKQSNKAESEEEIWAEEILPKAPKPSPKESSPEPIDNLDMDKETNYSDDDTDDEIQIVLDIQQKTDRDVGSETSASVSNKQEKGSRKSSPEKNESKFVKHSKKDENKFERNRDPEKNKDSSATNGHRDSSDEEEVYVDDTDIDEELHDTSSLPLPTLEDYFKGRCFLLYGEMAQEKRKLLTRYITAYNGQIEDYMCKKVNFVISDDKWDENFEEALNENPALQFVKPQWIWQCCDKKKLVPHQPFLIVPNV